MNKNKANYTKVRFNCKKVNFIEPLFTKMHTDPELSFDVVLMNLYYLTVSVHTEKVTSYDSVLNS